MSRVGLGAVRILKVVHLHDSAHLKNNPIYLHRQLTVLQLLCVIFATLPLKVLLGPTQTLDRDGT